MSQMRIHVSYIRQDDGFCRALVQALQQAGAFVWTDEVYAWDDDVITRDTRDTHDVETIASYEAASLYDPTDEEYDEDDRRDDELERWNETIASSYDDADASYDEIEVQWHDEGNALFSAYWEPYSPRWVYVVLLSQTALASRSFQKTASSLYKSETHFPGNIFLAVTVGLIEQIVFTTDNGWQFLAGVKRIEAPNRQPLPLEEAVRRTVEVLCLTPAGEVPVPPTPRPTEDPEDLLVRGNALVAQGRYTEALAFFEQATRRAPQHFAAWFNLGYTLFKLKRWSEVVAASEHATTLDPTFAAAWIILGAALNQLNRSEEGLAACERALALAPYDAIAWSNKGSALCRISRYDEALAACDQALLFDPTYAGAWNNKGVVLNVLKRYHEALGVVNHALTLDRTVAEFWDTKGEVLHGLQRDKEALRCFDRAITIAPGDGYYWKTKAVSLRALGSTAEAEAAERRANELGG